MPDIYLDVDLAVTVPVNLLSLIDDTDFKTREVAVAYNATGMDLVWNFITCAGVITQTAVTPTDGTGVYDWTHVGDGIYKMEIPASGGVSINNDTEGFGWFSGLATGVLPWRGPVIGFRRAAMNDLLLEGSTASTNLEDFFDGTGYAGGTAKLDVNVASMTAGTITAAAIATGAIDADAIADNAIDVGALAADCITAAKIAAGAIDAATFAAGAIDAAAIADSAIDIATFAADCKTGSNLNVDLKAITTGVDFSATMKTSINTEALDVVNVDTLAEMAQGAPAASPTMRQILNYLYRRFRNKTETTATLCSLYDDAGITVLCKSTLSDDATTFTMAEWITGA